MTIAQDWARQRNFAKKRLRGITASCQGLVYTEALSDIEKEVIRSAQRKLCSVVRAWDGRNKESKEKYLKRERR